MKGAVALAVILRGLKALFSEAKEESSNLKRIFNAIIRTPLKLIVTFLISPFILTVVIWRGFKRRDRVSIIRASIAVVGFVIASVVTYVFSTFLGGFVCWLFILTEIGIIAAIGVLLGGSMWVLVTVIAQILTFNFVTTFFLQLSKEDLITHIQDMIDEA